MKISTLTIISAVVASFFVADLAPAQMDYALGESAPMRQLGSAPSDSEPANVPPNQGQHMVVADGAYEDMMYGGEMMAEDYGMSGFNQMPFGTGRKIFVIPSTQIEINDHLAIERDIRVMTHILDRVLRKPVNKLGGVFTVMDDFFGHDSRVTQVVYLDGYGALFFMKVDFALVGPPQAPQAKEPNEPKEKVDTTWKQAERELYAPPRVATRRGTGRPAGPQYDAGKVELLKKNLVETLKHAANIRALKTDESVVLTIVGRAIISTAMVRGGENLQWTFRSGKWVPVTGDPMEASYPSLPPSVLTIRAKKSDIDAFSKGELDFDKFYARTQLLPNWSGSAVVTRTGMSMMR